MPTHNIDLANEKAPQQGELLRGFAAQMLARGLEPSIR